MRGTLLPCVVVMVGAGTAGADPDVQISDDDVSGRRADIVRYMRQQGPEGG